ncbi:MAG: tRNA pseudouridine(55) synthase TruB [Gemmatales bacterium]|nr:tRNA pseudouridine(55) synthase TruB [Gemmatales bacterium]MCS7159239.1 tRNA pseudouridine(55) synthase TruB [Gemmatales bacterium]MDW8174439.1 tRNA pseudouridine(55) synthase TruB [Gemmatales bacterium]
MKDEELHGFLVIDKPKGMTSREVVNCVQDWFPESRPGHAGTLDPLATGVLVVALGKATRLLEYVQNMRKVYRATLCLGARSATDDAEGPITPSSEARPVPEATLRESLAKLVGEIHQVPPAFSAVKVEGRRAWKAARRRQEVELAPRRVVVYRIDLLAYDWPKLDIEVECGRGTYIRALARDLGEQLGVGGYVEELRRLRVGPFRVEDAITLTVSPEEARAALRPLSDGVMELPRLTLADSDRIHRLCQGQRLILPPEYDVPTGALPPAGEVAVFDQQGQLVGIAHWDAVSRQLAPIKILQPCS